MNRAAAAAASGGYWPIPKLFDGETVVIIAGGQSLTAAQIRIVAMAKLAGRCRVVAVNDSIYLAWWADWLHACDRKWWLHHSGAGSFPGIKTTLEDGLPVAWDVHRLRNTGDDGFDPGPENVRTGRNGVYQVLHSMIHAGARRIGLLGVDMHGGWWFGRHPEALLRFEVDRKVIMVPRFSTLVPTLRERGIEVINCSPNSRLEAFPQATIEAFLT